MLLVFIFFILKISDNSYACSLLIIKYLIVVVGRLVLLKDIKLLH